MAYSIAILMGATSSSLWSKTATVCATGFSPRIPQQFQWTVLWLVNNEWVWASVWAWLQPRVVSAVLPFLHQHNEITPASPFPIVYYILVFFPHFPLRIWWQWLKRIRLLWLDRYESWFSILLRNFHDAFCRLLAIPYLLRSYGAARDLWTWRAKLH